MEMRVAASAIALARVPNGLRKRYEPQLGERWTNCPVMTSGGMGKGLHESDLVVWWFGVWSVFVQLLT